MVMISKNNVFKCNLFYNFWTYIDYFFFLMIMENLWKNTQFLRKKLFVNKSVQKNILSDLAPCLAAYRLALIQ